MISLGLALHSLLVVRCVLTSAYFAYPFFFIYVTVALARLVLILSMQLGLLQGDFPTFYWRSAEYVSPLRLLVCWEVFLRAFPPSSAVRQVARGALVGCMVLLSAYFAFGAEQTSTIPEQERQLSLAVAVWLAVVVVLSTYYGVRMTRAVWGMALGMGLYVSISLMNFSAFDLFAWFLPTWGWIRSFDFILMMLIWNWALWGYRPERPGAGPWGEVTQSLLLQWRAQWSNLRAGIKKAVGL